MGRSGGERMHRRLEGRNGKIYTQVVLYSRTLQDVADEFGLSLGNVSEIVKAVRQNIPDTSLADFRAEFLEQLRDLHERSMEIVDLTPAPVAVGKDGDILRDPATDEIVRDYSGRLNAMNFALKVMESKRKLVGADAPAKQEISGDVKYEIVGVDLNDLQ